MPLRGGLRSTLRPVPLAFGFAAHGAQHHVRCSNVKRDPQFATVASANKVEPHGAMLHGATILVVHTEAEYGSDRGGL
jgi:hypothetical protein